jgi:hypothetical protein
MHRGVTKPLKQALLTKPLKQALPPTADESDPLLRYVLALHLASQNESILYHLTKPLHQVRIRSAAAVRASAESMLTELMHRIPLTKPLHQVRDRYAAAVRASAQALGLPAVMVRAQHGPGRPLCRHTLVA